MCTCVVRERDGDGPVMETAVSGGARRGEGWMSVCVCVGVCVLSAECVSCVCEVLNWEKIDL